MNRPEAKKNNESVGDCFYNNTSDEEALYHYYDCYDGLYRYNKPLNTGNGEATFCLSGETAMKDSGIRPVEVKVRTDVKVKTDVK
jgi:hypothetical protein